MESVWMDFKGQGYVSHVLPAGLVHCAIMHVHAKTGHVITPQAGVACVPDVPPVFMAGIVNLSAHVFFVMMARSVQVYAWMDLRLVALTLILPNLPATAILPPMWSQP